MRIQNVTLLSLLFLLACCSLGEPISVTRQPLATAVMPTPTLFPPTLNPTIPLLLDEENPTPTSPSPIHEPTPEPITNDVSFTYESENGNFSTVLPAKALVYEEYSPSVDGVFVSVPDSTSIIYTEPNFALTLQWIALDEPTTLANFVAARSMCTDVTPDGGEAIVLDGREARLYAATACGAFYTSYIYLLTPDLGYIVTIRSTTPYRYLSEHIWEQLDTFNFLD